MLQVDPPGTRLIKFTNQNLNLTIYLMEIK